MKIFSILLLMFISIYPCSAIGEKRAVKLAEKYLAASEQAEKDKLAEQIKSYKGSPESVMNILMHSRARNLETRKGEIISQRFTAPDLRDKYRDDILCYYVPESYNTDQSFGLFICMHGGGRSTTNNNDVNRIRSLKNPNNLGPDVIENAPFITVTPSAPYHPRSMSRWTLPEADDYIAAVISECDYRFNIDWNRIYLGGFSMGGFGAYHLCQRLNDRIAAGIMWAGNWTFTNWRAVIGTPIAIVHGENDAVAPDTPGKEPRHRSTDVYYARSAHELLTKAGIDNLYLEHSNGHSMGGAESAHELFDWITTKIRDPFENHICAIDRKGITNDVSATPHCRWISILKYGNEYIEYDNVQTTGPPHRPGASREDFDKQGFELVKVSTLGGIVDATWKEGNLFEINTENVIKFSIWLHSAMVDFTRPVEIILNGKKREYMAVPSLFDALRSFERRKDWGLIYHAELIVDVNE